MEWLARQNGVYFPGRPLTPVSMPSDDGEGLSYPNTPSSSFHNGLNRPSMQMPLRTGSEMSAPVSDDIEVRVPQGLSCTVTCGMVPFSFELCSALEHPSHGAFPL
jgi:hypothetical protein